MCKLLHTLSWERKTREGPARPRRMHASRSNENRSVGIIGRGFRPPFQAASACIVDLGFDGFAGRRLAPGAKIAGFPGRLDAAVNAYALLGPFPFNRRPLPGFQCGRFSLTSLFLHKFSIFHLQHLSFRVSGPVASGLGARIGTACGDRSPDEAFTAPQGKLFRVRRTQKLSQS